MFRTSKAGNGRTRDSTCVCLSIRRTCKCSSGQFDESSIISIHAHDLVQQVYNQLEDDWELRRHELTYQCSLVGLCKPSQMLSKNAQ